MVNKLQQIYPMIRSREDILMEIRSKETLLMLFNEWDKEYQDEFLDFCTGVKGVRILRDQFFKEIFNPDVVPERLEELLSLILKMKVKILRVLPNESTRIAAEKSLLIMDIVIELEDGSIANVEVQRIGYAFPGQRSACYSADLLLRQYKRIKGEKGKRFSYRDIKKVYTIVFFENSTKEFHRVGNTYYHHVKHKSDTGIEIELLQEYVFIPLDIFKTCLHNKNVNINCKLEAWLTFLSVDDPEIIIRLIKKYPEFKVLYKEVYEMCLDIERMMNMFSKELAILDSNTVDYMIDEMQNTIDEQKNTIDEQKNTIDEQKNTINEQKQTINEQQKTIDDLNSIVIEMQNSIRQLQSKMNVLENSK